MPMRIWVVENAVYDELRAMEWYRYLCAMWMIGGELLQIYDDRMDDSERHAVVATIDLMYACAKSVKVSAESSEAGRELGVEWDRIIDEGENSALPSQLAMWLVFCMLAAEISGESPRNSAVEQVNSALTERFREKPRVDGRRNIQVIDPAEEIDDDSPMAILMRRVQRIVDEVPKVPGSVRDPLEVKSLIFQV